MGISSGLGSSALLPAGLGFRNVLINGDMRIAQRGTTSTTSSASGFACDRWNNFRGGGTSGITVSRQNAGLTGFQYCSRVQRDSGNTSTSAFYFVQNVESINSIPLAGKQVTLSFWARAGANYSASGGVLRSSIESLSYESNYWTSGDGAATTIFAQSNHVLTTSWQYFTVSGVMSSSHVQIFAAFKFVPVGTAGASDYFEITGVQLEQNTQPTPFEQRPIGIEELLCLRYFRVVGWEAIFGSWVSSTSFYFKVDNPVPMRTKPSPTLTTSSWNISDFDAGRVATPTLSVSGNANYSFRIEATGFSGAVAYRPAGSNTQNASMFTLSAEL